MSDVEWDAEDYVRPPPQPASRVVTDKWDGEDEEEEIKENWEDDDEGRENEISTQTDSSTKVQKKKKKIADIIAEKEKRQSEEHERRIKEREKEKKMQTLEEVLKEKQRIQKIQEDSDLSLAVDLLDVNEKKSRPLSDYDLVKKNDLNEFRLELIKKIRNSEGLEKKPFYISFLEDLFHDLCENLELDDIKRVTSVLNALYNEKVKASKPVKGKKKGATKAKLNVGQGVIADDITNSYQDFGYDEFDDYI